MTQAVFFDVLPKPNFVDAYFAMAVGLRPIVEQNPGFISVERFANLQKSDWYLSFSQWKNEDSLKQWRCQYDHNGAQVCGRNLVLEDYRLRVGEEKTTDDFAPSNRAREGLAVLVGDFEKIKALVKQADMQLRQPRLFKGIINPQRGIALCDLSIEQGAEAMPLKASQLGAEIDLRWFEVCRDYGMFDRAEAPQQFA